MAKSKSKNKSKNKYQKLIDARTPVFVTWEDSTSTNGRWISLDNYDLAKSANYWAVMNTVAFIVEDHPRHILTAATVHWRKDGDHNITGDLTIPKSAILRLTPLKGVKLPPVGDRLAR